MPTFSVIIPIYNIEDYINECIKSVLEQTYSDFEIILVDDGSTDDSSSICDEFSNKYENITVLHKRNGGLSSARNEGVKLAKGDYLLFVDGDDFIDHEALKNMNNIINENPGVDLICGKFFNYFPDGSLDYEDFDFPYIDKNTNGIDALTALFAEVPVIIWSACRTIYRRDYFVNNGFHFEEGITSEDLELVPKIYMRAKSVTTCNSPFYYYRQNRENSIINTINSKRFYDIFRIIKSHIRMIQEGNTNKNFNDQFLKELANIYARYVVLVMKVPIEERNQVIDKMEELKWILKYSTGIRGTYVSISTKLMGMYLTSVLYNLSKRFN
jgi:glycosyltransferase involved in cell wall biosynthesis